MSEYPGFVLKAGQMVVDGEQVCAALVEFPNDPPDYLTNNIIWNRVPIAIVTEEEIESLRSKLSAAEARAEKAEAELADLKKPDLFWLNDDPETNLQDGPFAYLRDEGIYNAPVPIMNARSLPTKWVVFVPTEWETGFYGSVYADNGEHLEFNSKAEAYAFCATIDLKAQEDARAALKKGGE